MAMALAAGLPARLSAVADALELANRKDAAGERLMHQMSKPRRAHKDEDPDSIYWFDDQERLDRLYDYCRQDVEVERELYGRLPPLSPAEQALWELSCKINERGFRVDRKFAEAARQIAQAAAPEIDAELAELTGGAVTGINQIARLLQWLQQQGCTLQKLDRRRSSGSCEAEDLPPAVRRVLELRLGGAQAAVKKIDALLARAGDDDRVRGAFRYHGAATGRWAGEGFQPQNLKRPSSRISTPRSPRSPPAIMSTCASSIRGRSPWSAIAAAAMISRSTRSRADRRRLQLRSKAGCWLGLPAKNGSSTAIAALTPRAIRATSRIV